MTNAKHTPGPWYVNDQTIEQEYGQIQIQSDTGCIAICGEKNGSEEVHWELRPNARLIAAAPDMLAFIESLTLANGLYPDLNGHPVVAAAYALLTKAQGGAA